MLAKRAGVTLTAWGVGQPVQLDTVTDADRLRKRLLRGNGVLTPAPSLPQEPHGMTILPPGAAMGTQLPLRLANEKSTYRHWSKVRKRVQFERQYVYDRLMSLWEDGPLLGLPLTIKITRIAPRPLDDDNLVLACSAVRDGVSDFLAGKYLGGQDRQPGLLWTYAQYRLAPKFYAVEIRVERPKP
jgi:hypothetical protein